MAILGLKAEEAPVLLAQLVKFRAVGFSNQRMEKAEIFLREYLSSGVDYDEEYVVAQLQQKE